MQNTLQMDAWMPPLFCLPHAFQELKHCLSWCTKNNHRMEERGDEEAKINSINMRCFSSFYFLPLSLSNCSLSGFALFFCLNHLHWTLVWTHSSPPRWLFSVIHKFNEITFCCNLFVCLLSVLPFVSSFEQILSHLNKKKDIYLVKTKVKFNGIWSNKLWLI